MILSIIIPARNEEGSVAETLSRIRTVLAREAIRHEIIVVDDGSSDATASLVREIAEKDGAIRLVANPGPHGYGLAVRAGLAVYTGDAAVVMMADGSDDPEELPRYYAKLQEGYDCVFGSRFIEGSRVIDYPPHKLILNRLANLFIRLLFGLTYNDTTNAFKCYHRSVIHAMQPLISRHFNLTVEMPLKAIVRGCRYAVVPISWTNRKSGASKLEIKEMGGRYLFIVLYLWLERHLAHADYRRDPRDA